MKRMRNKVAAGVRQPPGAPAATGASVSGSQPCENEKVKRLQQELLEATVEISTLKRDLAAEKSKNVEQAEKIQEATVIIVDLRKDLEKAEKGENELKNLLQQEKTRRIEKFMASSQTAADTLEDEEPTSDIPELGNNLTSSSTVGTIQSPVSGPTGGDGLEEWYVNTDSIYLEHAEDTSKSDTGVFCICHNGHDYKNKRQLNLHIRYYTYHNFKCDLCHRKFQYICYFKSHKLLKHKVPWDDNLPSVGCPECGQVFLGTAQLWNHRHREHFNPAVEWGEAQPPENEDSNDRDHQMESVIEEDNLPLLRAATSNESCSIEETADKETVNAKVKHALDIGKRADGIFCRCGLCFISREELDSHLSTVNSRNSVGDDRNDDDFQMEDEVESSESSSEDEVKAKKKTHRRKYRKRKQNLREARNGTKLKRGRKSSIHGTRAGKQQPAYLSDENRICPNESVSMDMGVQVKLEPVIPSPPVANSGKSFTARQSQSARSFDELLMMHHESYNPQTAPTGN